MIREERNPEFWVRIVEEPTVAAALGQFSPMQIAAIIAMPDVLPLAAEHGGFLFAGLGPFGRVAELHTMFTPEGWGREVHGAAKEAFDIVFDRGVRIIVTHQMEANERSQPPRTFGFVPAGDMAPSILGTARTWILTYPAWLASPGRASRCN